MVSGQFLGYAALAIPLGVAEGAALKVIIAGWRRLCALTSRKGAAS